MNDIAKPLLVTVLVRNHAGDIIREKYGTNYHNKKERIQLSRTSWWALHNGHTIQITPDSDFNQENGRRECNAESHIPDC